MFLVVHDKQHSSPPPHLCGQSGSSYTIAVYFFLDTQTFSVENAVLHVPLWSLNPRGLKRVTRLHSCRYNSKRVLASSLACQIVCYLWIFYVF